MSKKDILSKGLAGVTHQKEKNDEEIKQNIVIWAEFESLIPALQLNEKQQLEENILAEGCREALILWKNEDSYILIDGHNRYQICQKHGINFKILVKEFENLAAAKSFMINNQLGRRNLTTEQASYLRGKRYENEKNKQGGIGENQYSKVAKFATLQKTHEKLAQEYSVSARTIMNDSQFAKAIDKIGEVNPTLRKEILSGATRINKSQIQEIAKMEALPHLENIQDLENLFLSKTEKTTDELKAKKDFLAKFIKNSNFDLMSLEQIEKLCLDLAKKS